jgi:hypothetical protein
MQVDAAPYHFIHRLFGFLHNERALIGPPLCFATKPNYALVGSFPFHLFCHGARALSQSVREVSQVSAGETAMRFFRLARSMCRSSWETMAMGLPKRARRPEFVARHVSLDQLFR